MNTDHQKELSVAQQAAEWLQRTDLENPQASAEFLRWLKASPVHVREFMIAGRLQELACGIDPDCKIDVKALVAEAKQNILPFDAGARVPPVATQLRRTNRWSISRIASAALVVVIVALTSLVVSFTYRRNTYTTEAGEQELVKLEDGSTVVLNTKSQVTTRLTAKVRDVELVEGQALFQVRSDPARPFRVHTMSATIQVIGTQFDVRNFQDRHAIVAVVEGTVLISTGDLDMPDSKASDQIRITKGEGARIEASGRIERLTDIDIDTVMAWRRYQLRFDLATLEQIASEFNRYNSVPRLQIEGVARNRRLSGVFDARSPTTLLDYLVKEGLSVERHGDEIIIR